MELFHPGQEYGHDYEYFIWVCQNPSERSFEKCSFREGTLVHEQLLGRLQTEGLSRKCFVFRSGCLLGCHAVGTTVAIAKHAKGEQKTTPPIFLRNVTVTDLEEILKLLKA